MSNPLIEALLSNCGWTKLRNQTRGRCELSQSRDPRCLSATALHKHSAIGGRSPWADSSFCSLAWTKPILEPMCRLVSSVRRGPQSIERDFSFRVDASELSLLVSGYASIEFEGMRGSWQPAVCVLLFFSQSLAFIRWCLLRKRTWRPCEDLDIPSVAE